MELTHQDVRNLLQIIDDAEHLDEVEIVHGGFRLHVRRKLGQQAGPVAEPTVSVQQPVSKPPALSGASAAASTDAFSATVSPAGPDGSAAPGADQAAAKDSIAIGQTGIRAPMLGTFYRAPAPGEKAFVEVGQIVKADDTLCLIEVMKLFNSIKAGADGRVVRICVEDAELVEYNQLLVVIEASA